MWRGHDKRITLQWGAAAVLLAGLAALFTYHSYRFGYAYQVAGMPALWLTGGLMAAGAAYLLLPRLIRATLLSIGAAKERRERGYLLLLIALGLLLRLILMASEPALEDDYQRYLWDGAVTASGLNPYAVSPEEAMEEDQRASAIAALAKQGEAVLPRVNHPELRTLYPPVAQGLFALAHLLKPWSLTAWRAVCLAFDLATLGLLLLLLRETGLSPLWAALYWLNPLVLKELFNSAHMEAVLPPFILAAVWLALRRRSALAAASLALAAGIKFWPALLLPFILRPLLAAPRQLLLASGVFAGICALWALPMLAAGFGENSGLVHYAQRWKTSSALFPLLEKSAAFLLPHGAAGIGAGLAVRALIALALGGLALWLNRKPFRNAGDLLRRCVILTGALVLLSPAQFPWYYLWVMPFLVFWPVPGLMVLTVTLPLFYTSHYLIAWGHPDLFPSCIVWLIWLPAWGLLLFNLLKNFLPPRLSKQRAAARPI